MGSSQLPTVSADTTPAHIIAGNNDLLTEILKHLPVISLLRFKSVSKNWLTLITDPLFSRLQTLKTRPIAFFLPTLHSSKNFDFVPVDPKNPTKSPFRTLEFASDVPGITILSSSNGLLCCGNVNSPNITLFYVYNPSNQKFATVPPPELGAGNRIIAMNVAFDPLNSPLYKLVSVVLVSNPPHQRTVRIHIYSSETGNWKLCVETLDIYFRTQFNSGVYFNGAIHWYSQSLNTYYFDVDQERSHVIPMPPFDYESPPQFRYNRYFGECSGHLHLIESYGPMKVEFDVYEMEKDHSGWFVKYRVNLHPMVDMYPQLILNQSDPIYRLHHGCFPLYMIETESESHEDAYLVFHTPGRIVRYNLIDNTLKLHLDFDSSASNNNHFFRFHSWAGAFPFIPSICCI